MADYSKFGLVASMVVSPVERIYAIISDKKLTAEYRNQFENMGVHIFIS